MIIMQIGFILSFFFKTKEYLLGAVSHLVISSLLLLALIITDSHLEPDPGSK